MKKLFQQFTMVAAATALMTVGMTVARTQTASAASITNGGFETGDFAGWTVNDLNVTFQPMDVLSGGTATNLNNFIGGNLVMPSDGEFAAVNGFDGNSGNISLSQNIGTINSGDVLSFDYRAAWDMITFSNPTARERSFKVQLAAADGGNPLEIFDILTAENNTSTVGGSQNNDTGMLSESIDLSAFAGLDASLSFLWSIPDNFTGPANFQLDNVQIQPGSTASVPEPTTILGLFAVGGAGVVSRRKKQAAK